MNVAVAARENDTTYATVPESEFLLHLLASHSLNFSQLSPTGELSQFLN